jgi:hypothetical protein
MIVGPIKRYFDYDTMLNYEGLEIMFPTTLLALAADWARTIFSNCSWQVNFSLL